MRKTEPKTALEALRSWEEDLKWIDDPDSGTTPMDIYESASQTVELAKTENIPLLILVPDEATRKSLEEDAEAFLNPALSHPDYEED